MSETLIGRHALHGDEPDGPDDTGAAGDPPTQALVPPLAVPIPTAAPAEQVICPECGTVAMVALTRREAHDFCAQCDYPLFWTPSKVVLDAGITSTESLRRLPGTAGRVIVGSIPCPHCAEGNLLTAELCTRCGGLMVLPAPAPALAAPPPPPPAPEPQKPVPLWIWALGASTLLLLIALVVYFVTSR